MKLDFDIRWLIGDSKEELDPRLLPLLTTINQTGSLQTAATELGISYRTAWQIIRYWNKVFHSPICVLERGRGTRLTTLGLKLIKTRTTIDSDFSEILQKTADNLNNEIKKLVGKHKHKQKMIAYTSHDLAIGYLQSLCEKTPQLDIEFHSQGSLDNLKFLNSRQADIVGFHFPEGPLANTLASVYSNWLDDNKHILIHLAMREQGLILKPSLAGHVTSLQGLARRSVKFVNRQKGSGTRAIFDELTKLNGINRKIIRGYEKEEFTHTAVAAMISSGHADVGFGLKAAAVQFKLSFLPLITESYIIAMNKALPEVVKKEIRMLTKNDKLRNTISKLPGYNARLTGKIIHVKKMLGRTTS